MIVLYFTGLCNVLGHLATALTLSQGSNDNVAKSGSKYAIF